MDIGFRELMEGDVVCLSIFKSKFGTVASDLFKVKSVLSDKIVMESNSGKLLALEL